ncbi:acyl-CoA dehydrogenase family protein [Rosistilla oblonga]|uniref:Putative acyl-CoA dehydrogenase n=1 Tax=Rosistilla oblonga TaxID=2527990 RepID=A0A518IY40_9BACT|nr:acyl-CoA dehydrogenase family protein [Rosistilla oblonga]QDV58009.1 putative acyl-CoA dehydrogenase [Rosistilla oblonga]
MGSHVTEPSAERLQQRAEQIRQAEELLGSLPQTIGLAKGLFAGRLIADWVFPYPQLSINQKADTDAAVAELEAFCDRNLDPVRIDREADIPRELIDGLGQFGLLGMTAPAEFGGRGYSQMAYCQLLEVIGSRCSSTAIFVNAHHSIGMRGLLLFGSDSQRRRWLPDLVSGKKLAAFALTEPEAGSDASNVQTMAVPTADGQHFVLNGQKRYITNGAIADVLTVMARTPVAESDKTAITAFLVTPDMPGFQVTEPRMEKLGIRGTATSRLAFDNMHVPRENILGPIGKGLKVALTVLDFGRTTFGACCTGAAKTCLQLATDHAHRRRQFGRSLAEFELVQQKLVRMAAWTYAMEAMTTVTAGLIDRGLEDYMLETAMLKVWSTERLWAIVNDAFQIHGGAAYFTDLSLERMLRDHRINQIGEGANEVLMSFIALTGMRGPGLQMQAVSQSWKHPLRDAGLVYRFATDGARLRCCSPAVPLRSPELQRHGRSLGKQIRRFGATVQKTLVTHREEVLERQLVLERIAWMAMELFAAASTLSRLDSDLANNDRTHDAVARWCLADSHRRVEGLLRAMRCNDDDLLKRAASGA